MQSSRWGPRKLIGRHKHAHWTLGTLHPPHSQRQHWTLITRGRFRQNYADVEKVDAVRRAMQHAWKGYEDYAWGADELKPASKQGKMGVTGGQEGFHGLGASIVDAMSTLHIMGLKDQFQRGQAWITENMTFDTPNNELMPVSFFEITIRVLGGLLAAYDLSGQRIFWDRALDLGTRLAPAFDGSPSGIVTNQAELPWTLPKVAYGDEVLAELGSNSLEFGTLTLRSGNETFRTKAEKGLRFLHEKHPDNPLLGISVERETGTIFDSGKSLGAPVDSYFEYLIKYWILMGKNDEHWRSRWVDVVDASFNELLLRPNNSDFAIVGEKHGNGQPAPVITHLGCFWPGNVALGVMQGAVTGPKAEQYLEFAKGMMYACAQLYNTTTGLGAERAHIDMKTGNVLPSGGPYLQRPEVVESLFYLWRATHDQKYRDWGWGIFQAIEKHCKKEAGYSGTMSVSQDPPESNDRQESWFLAETLKYLYLLFSDDDILDLSQWVFNTEAHPLRARPH